MTKHRKTPQKGLMRLRKRLICPILLAILLLLCACTPPFEKDAPMTHFSFSHSGMHTGLMYTLSAGRTDAGWKAEVSLLAGDREHILDMTDEDVRRLEDIVQIHNLKAWAGFDKVDRHALDGTDFSLSIDFEDGKHLFAQGSNAFPKGYAEAHNDIRTYFGNLMEINGIENPM